MIDIKKRGAMKFLVNEAVSSLDVSSQKPINKTSSNNPIINTANINIKEKYIRWTDKGLRYYYFYEEKEIHDLFKDAGFKIKSTHNSEMMINFIAQK